MFGLRAFVCPSLVALLVFSAVPVAAGEGDTDSHTRTAARALAAQGSQAFDKQDYKTALDLFQRAFALIEAPTIALMEARTLVQLGRWVEAADRYAAVQKMQSQAPNAAFTQAVDAATQELALLMPRIPTLKLTLSGAAGERVDVSIDGRRLPDVLVGVDNPVDPGPHRVEVRRANGQVEQRSVRLAESERQVLEIELSPAPTVAAPARRKPVVVEAPEPDSMSGRTLAYVVLGAGAAATAFGAVTGVIALDARKDLERECSPGCPEQMRDQLDRYRSTRTLSYVGFGLGVIGIGAGSYLLFTAEPEGAPVAVGVSPGGVAMRGVF